MRIPRKNPLLVEENNLNNFGRNFCFQKRPALKAILEAPCREKNGPEETSDDAKPRAQAEAAGAWIMLGWLKSNAVLFRDQLSVIRKELK